ncbi:MAG: hypothetical protein ACXVQQ_05145, partial [Gaiellaceae bacterium]
MEVQTVLDKARETLAHAHDGTPAPKKKTVTVRKVLERIVLPLVALVGLAALIRPRRPAKPPKARFSIPL